MIDFEEITGYILPYLPTILESIITFIICYFLKKLSANTSNIDGYKTALLKDMERTRDTFNEINVNTNNKLLEAIDRLERNSEELKANIEELDRLKEENKTLKTSIAEQDKKLVTIESLLRRETW